MKYCSNECCRKATNAKLVAKYHENKALKNRINRLCIDCSVKLSRYNDNERCYICISKIEKENRIKLFKEFNDVI